MGAYRISPHGITRDQRLLFIPPNLLACLLRYHTDAQTHKYSHLDTYYKVKRMCNGYKDSWAVKDLGRWVGTAEDGYLTADTQNNGIQIFS